MIPSDAAGWLIDPKWPIESQILTRIFTAAEVKTWHSVHPILIPAVPGFIIRPLILLAFRDAGSAFTLGTAVLGQLRYNSSDVGATTSACLNFNLVGFLDQTTEKGASGAASFNFLLDEGASGRGGKDIVMAINENVDVTGTGGPVTVFVSYQMYPCTLANFARMLAIGG